MSENITPRFYDLKNGDHLFGVAIIKQNIPEFDGFGQPSVYVPAIREFVVCDLDHKFQETKVEHDYFGDVVDEETYECDAIYFCIAAVEHERELPPIFEYCFCGHEKCPKWYKTVTFSERGNQRTNKNAKRVEGPSYNGTLCLTLEEAKQSALDMLKRHSDQLYKFCIAYDMQSNVIKDFVTNNNLPPQS